ncbi:hypothetical protein [Natrinema caseinilyticum]|uniref:hypothetical protein n=1 Tax=Natrinema caseinilyticum TaxID=2961570 RepID=UPI0020C36116|nr:hypothetical protein [Natrinema caseinilyticum]
MSEADDPRCPDCGEPVGQTATYCMHCWADIPDGSAVAGPGEDGVAESEESAAGTSPRSTGRTGATTPADSHAGSDRSGLLDPHGIVDNTLTAVVGIVGGLLVGVVGTFVLAIVAGGGVAGIFGLVTWVGATVYLVRCRTVQEAVAKSGYAVAIVLLFVPVIAFSPFVTVEGGLGARGGFFVVLLVFVTVPAAVAAGIGWVASKFVPEGTSNGDL